MVTTGGATMGETGDVKIGPRFRSFISGNVMFEAAAAALGLGRPAARLLLNDALLGAGVSPDAVTRDDMVRCLPNVAALMHSIFPAALAEERLAGFAQFLRRP
jgi:hypothetical protein